MINFIIVFFIFLQRALSFNGNYNVHHHPQIQKNKAVFPSIKVETLIKSKGKSKSAYTGVGSKVAEKIKEQFRLETDSQVRSLRRALKKFKEKEEKKMIKSRMNTLKSQQMAGLDEKSESKDKKNSITPSTNPFGKPGKKKSKAKIGPKPIRLGLSLDMASDLYGGGTSLLKDIDPHHRKITTLNFVGSYLHTTTLPSLGLPEICLVGRSNVGKSSFINSLMSYIKNKTRKADSAFVSKTPGYTKSINIFEAVDARDRGVLSLVDLPGYGHTNIKNKETRKTMQSIMKAYLKRRLEIKLVLFLVDGSQDPAQDDYEVLQYFKEKGTPNLFILTKMDKVPLPQTSGQVMAFRQYFDLKPPLPILFSKFGRADLGCIWKAIFDACTDTFDPSKLNIQDKFDSVEPDFSSFVKAQEKISLKDLKKLIFKNFDSLPESVKTLDLDSMDRDQLLDVLELAADRRFEIERKPLDLVQLKHKLTKY